MDVTYCTREATKAALDSKLTARDDDAVDRANLAATESINQLLHWAHLHPVVDTRYFDYPNWQRADAGRIYLDNHGLLSLTSVTTGGTTIAVGQVLLEPVNDGPPYEWIELDRDTTAAFGGTIGGRQRNVALTGLWAGAPNTETPAGSLAEALDASEPGVDVSDVSDIGIGSLLVCENERMIVSAKGLLASGQTLGTDLAAQANAELVNLVNGAVFHVGEVLTIDAERMLLVDIAGNNGIVKRQWDGSTLAAHSTGATIYVPRALTVERGAAGTTAATHADATAVRLWTPPSIVTSLAIAEAVSQVEQEQAAYGRTVGSGDNERESAGKGLMALRARAKAAYGRMRKDAI